MNSNESMCCKGRIRRKQRGQLQGKREDKIADLKFHCCRQSMGSSWEG